MTAEEKREVFISAYEAEFGPLFRKGLLPRTKALWVEFIDRLKEHLIEPLIQNVSEGWTNDYKKPELKDFRRAYRPMMAAEWEAERGAEKECALCEGTGYMRFYFHTVDGSLSRKELGFKENEQHYSGVVTCPCRLGEWHRRRYHPETNEKWRFEAQEWLRARMAEASEKGMTVQHYLAMQCSKHNRKMAKLRGLVGPETPSEARTLLDEVKALAGKKARPGAREAARN